MKPNLHETSHALKTLQTTSAPHQFLQAPRTPTKPHIERMKTVLPKPCIYAIQWIMQSLCIARGVRVLMRSEYPAPTSGRNPNPCYTERAERRILPCPIESSPPS